MTPLPEHISVIIPVGQAIDRVKRILFQPFDLAKWFAIGFCAWLANLGRGGFHYHHNFGPGHGEGMNQFRDWVESTRDYITSNLSWLLPLAVGLILLGTAIWVLLLWLSSRGRFMLLHCVALDKAEVAVPWRKFAREANSVFWFRLVVSLIGMVVTLPPLAIMAVAGWRMIEHGEASADGILVLIATGLFVLLIAVVWWVMGKLTTDFVVPIMYRRGGGCLGGWGVVLRLIVGNLGRFVLYLLFQIVLAIATAVLVLTAMVVTCCIFCCVAIIPYLGTVLLLPIFVFQRAYSACYLAQYGPDYDVFAPAPEAAP